MSNIAVDAFLHGIAKNIQDLEGESASALVKRYKDFRASKIFSKELSLEAILKKEKVNERLEIADRVFSQ